MFGFNNIPPLELGDEPGSTVEGRGGMRRDVLLPPPEAEDERSLLPRSMMDGGGDRRGREGAVMNVLL